MAEKNNVYPIICINKIDLNSDYTDIIENYKEIDIKRENIIFEWETL